MLSDGVGRSGTFVCIYSELERVKTEGVADIFQFIKKARSQRAGLVQEVVCSSVVDIINDNIINVRSSTYFVMKFFQNMQKKYQNMTTLKMLYNKQCCRYVCMY